MLALAIIFTVLILIAFLRFGVIAEYSEEGIKLWAKAGFLKFELLKDNKKKKDKKKKKEKPKKPVNMKPGSFDDFMVILRSVKNALGRLKRRLLIKNLTLYYLSAGDDPADTAIRFGAVNAVFGAIIPVFERAFRIKHKDLRASADFDAKEQRIYAKIVISIAVWEVFYIVFALFPIIITLFKKKPDQKIVKSSKDIKDRKDGQDDGKSTD